MNRVDEMALVCKEWYLQIQSTRNHFARVPPEYQLVIFSHATEYCPAELAKISLVCRAWQKVLEDDSLWKPAFIRCVQICTYDIDLSSAPTYQKQVKLVIETTLHDFKETLIACAVALGKPRGKIEEPTSSETKYFLEKIDHTDLCEKLIAKGKLELLAKLILFKPKFDPNKLAEILILFIFSQDQQLRAQVYFVFGLIVKLGYHTLPFLNKLLVLFPRLLADITTGLMFGCCKGIKISSLIKSGFTPHLVELQQPHFSVLQQFLPHFAGFYSTKGRFEAPPLLGATPSFSDEKLQKHIRKGPFSEEELKEFIFDLLTRSHINLYVSCPELGPFRAGTALSQLRQLATRLPADNAISGALAAYDKGQKSL
jgi:hypothetical protein